MRKLPSVALALTFVVFLPAGAAAGNRYCANETITYPEVVDGNLIVVKPPIGLGVCLLLGVQVNGNVLVQDDGLVDLNQCQASNGDSRCPNAGPQVRTKVLGNVISDGAPRRLRLFGAQVFGNVLVKNTHGNSINLICSSDIHGHLQIMDNQVGVGVGRFYPASPPLPAGGCGSGGPTVDLHMLVSGNTADVDIEDTTVMGQLHCVNNEPPPSDEGGNVILGQAKGQCSGFVP